MRSGLRTAGIIATVIGGGIAFWAAELLGM